MTTTEASPADTGTGYQLEGSLLEVCDCNTLCPCWIGEDPDGGTCQSVVAYHLDKGLIRGVDVSGLTLVSVVHIPGNVLQATGANWFWSTTAPPRSNSRRCSTPSAAHWAAHWPISPS